jgi:hypothetical protein
MLIIKKKYIYIIIIYNNILLLKHNLKHVLLSVNIIAVPMILENKKLSIYNFVRYFLLYFLWFMVAVTILLINLLKRIVHT